MINFLEAVKHQLHQFVEIGHSKPVHLMQNQLINDIYHAIDHNQMVMLTSNQKTYKGYINRYDRERQTSKNHITTRLSLSVNLVLLLG